MRKYITQDEWNRVFSVLHNATNKERDQCLLYLTYIHGLRVSELTSLKVSDIDIAGKTIYIKRLKNGFSTTHPISKTEKELILKWLKIRNNNSVYRASLWLFPSRKGGKLSRQWVHVLMGRYGEQAGLSIRLHPHKLRHSCGFELANQGLDTRLIQDYLGHRNIRHTMHYTASNPERFQKAWQQNQQLKIDGGKYPAP
ncbi:tyrosine-type recombinase/integrase [Xenorhabdus bovienii]|uniref:Tyrosine-type recombinase/integrase n=2 Tax=Xenorhabdus bovienii TaxID=40576 RepID=A0AAJ1J3Y9_XENBV|nr:tyrosine-type recombinase/integrase [Xenorhabdus bovienii]MDE1473125.1 tyrosine-type recombinase/integrase [Xenorhabdus bovienii]MDE1476985.1 tyrosine-type recombinase/integrase [Xenorhabdus bovienii]MDE1481996.1 tyrosine-type recombinase/integrase [Xenorhabdus bovienii]MDE1485197.1 tyrosine-type recombinase/integrase [Xenorhabdus bovienii]MDE1489950.1 tyrosine-type recombinase/integrase [Xenorhabdus bovienii]